MVVRIQIAFKTIPTPKNWELNWEIESKEDHLTVIKLSEIDGFSQQVELNTGTKELGN